VLGFVGNPRILKIGELQARRHIRNQIKDPVLRKKVTPDFHFGCKRVLISNNYYPALAQDPIPSGMVYGRGGQDLLEAWEDGAEAYKGTNVAGFPNYFMLMGPNTGLGYSSMDWNRWYPMVNSRAIASVKSRSAADMGRSSGDRLYPYSARWTRTLVRLAESWPWCVPPVPGPAR